VSLTVVTWNLKGSAGPDLATVAAHLRDVGADVVALQETQRHQARALARQLGARSLRWGFKHWPVRARPEGMAVIGVTVPVEARTRALSFRWRPWSWRRRIYQVASLPPTAEGGTALLLNVHFSTERQREQRARELAVVVASMRAGGATILAGDTNDRPGSALFADLAAAGLRDAWAEAHPGSTEPDGATNWAGWRRGTTKPPTRRIDVVAVAGDVTIESVSVPRFGDDGFERFPAVSDHLPLSATLGIGMSRPA
jgi:endonuclease/exonuclease/phosphatase family metal-dependent hydrolase